MERLAVIIPSRGMSFSKTMDEMLRELKGLNYKLFFSVGHSLPDCFNIPLEEILKDEFSHVLIVEDDMIIPKGILKQMLREHYPVVALDYPFRKDGDGTVLYDPEGFALYSGTGFILIERWVLDKMPKPIFRTDIAWDSMLTKRNELVFWPRDVSKSKTYGLHDVNFGLTMWSNNIPILIMKKTAGQHKLRQLGKQNTNIGVHDIYDLTVVLRNNVTQQEDDKMIAAYLDRINRITDIIILDKIPDNIYYEEGQARLKNGKQIII